VREEIRGLEEWPAHGVTPGAIKVLVGRVDERGNFLVPQTFETYHIEGEMYEQLVAVEAPAWAPNKPPGTYRNEDLWHFIDLVRAGAAAGSTENLDDA
jgi:hypothetical protein